MKNVLKNYNKYIYDTFLDQTNNDLVMFRPIHINSSQLLCACQGSFNITWEGHGMTATPDCNFFFVPQRGHELIELTWSEATPDMRLKLFDPFLSLLMI